MATIYVRTSNGRMETYSDLSGRFGRLGVRVGADQIQKDYPTLWDGEAITEPTATASGFVNFNSASLSDLVKVRHIGPVTARSIISHRKKHGPFKTSRDLIAVNGIGDKTHALIKRHVRLSGITTLK